MKNYSDCTLMYNISEDKRYGEINEKNYNKMKEALDAVGILLNVENGVLRLSIYQDGYDRKQKRNAGRKKKRVWKEEDGKCDLYRYSDIVYMMQFMKDQEIAAKIEMPIATFYRHKKTLKESVYYVSLDLNKLKNKEYLDSVHYNFLF